jgi:hypothetical protein
MSNVGIARASRTAWKEVMKVVEGSDIAFHCSGFKRTSKHWSMDYKAGPAESIIPWDKIAPNKDKSNART